MKVACMSILIFLGAELVGGKLFLSKNLRLGAGQVTIDLNLIFTFKSDLFLIFRFLEVA